MSLRMLRDVMRNREIGTHCPLCGRSFGRVASTEEHIFPVWLQHKYDLWNRKLTIPNLIGKSYTTVKIDICIKCNGDRYGKVEGRLSKLFCSQDPFSALQSTEDDELALWLGKIFWLLCRKSNSVDDFRTRNDVEKDRIIPRLMMDGVLYAGMIQRAFAMKKGMYACYLDDPPLPAIYEPPFSLYRFKIDTRDDRFERFDFTDNVSVLGTAMRIENFGMICVFDGGLHRKFLSSRYEFLAREKLHPMQFNEVVGRIFYDQTVLVEEAHRVTYFWNRNLKSVISMLQMPRGASPYLQSNHDPQRYAAMLGHHTCSDPESIVSNEGSEVFTMLTDKNGKFLRYAVTESELQAAKDDPNQTVRGPFDVKWRKSGK